MTISEPENNNSLWGVWCPTQNVAYGRFASQSCIGRRSKVQTSVMLLQSWCFAHKGWIHLQHTRKAVTFNCRNLRPLPRVSVHFSLPSTRDRHFRAPKKQVFTNGPKSGDFKRRHGMDEYRGFRMQHCARSVNGCYRISIILAFLCGRAKKIQIRFVWMRISDTCGQGLIVVNFKRN